MGYLYLYLLRILIVFVIFFFGSKQYHVKIGDLIKLDKISFDPGEIIKFNKVLLVKDKNKINIGKPFLKYMIEGKVNYHGKYKKINIIKFKRRKHYKKSMGHRQYFTEVKIINIQEMK